MDPPSEDDRPRMTQDGQAKDDSGAYIPTGQPKDDSTKFSLSPMR
jgi:hypothetical protein